jgi:hypothetical protein
MRGVVEANPDGSLDYVHYEGVDHVASSMPRIIKNLRHSFATAQEAEAEACNVRASIWSRFAVVVAKRETETARVQAHDQYMARMEATDYSAFTVAELAIRQSIDRGSGGLNITRRFRVQRPGHASHVVGVRVSHSGCPQEESCDCQAYQFYGDCIHIHAVYDAGVLTIDCEG